MNNDNPYQILTNISATLSFSGGFIVEAPILVNNSQM